MTLQETCQRAILALGNPTEDPEELASVIEALAGFKLGHDTIIVSGNPMDGLQFHGPFPSMEAAHEWAEVNCGEWHSAPIDGPGLR